jgi:predicted porin
MKLNKKLLAGLVAFAAANSAQAVTVLAEDGWTLGVSGSINQFAVFTENDAVGGEDLSEIRDGLLPSFINFDMKAPTINGLDIAAHISFSPSTNVDSYSGIEQREVYFTVDGSFGQILAGKALGLYGSHNILTDQSLFGVGYGTGGNGTTTLGSIGLGYDYASWRSQIRWTSKDMNGFKLALAVVDSSSGAITLNTKPTGSIVTGNEDSDDLRYEADLSYAGAFDGGSYKLWASAAVQDHEDLAEDARYWTVGGTLSVAGFEFMAQYSDAEDGTDTASAAAIPGATVADKQEWDQFMVQAGYRFNGTTLVSANYAELEDKNAANDDTIEKYTVGVYHDVNSNLKLVAEYTAVEDDNSDLYDQEIIAIGGFVFF